MENNKSITKEDQDTALHYMQTLVDVARESFLILNAKLDVISANDIFYQTFKVSQEETEKVPFYKLGNGQWDIPELKKLLEEILPQKEVVKDYEVNHVFETIGEKTMVLNARQVDSVQLIILAIEDMTTRKDLEKKLEETVKNLAAKVAKKTKDLTDKIKELESTNQDMVGREVKMVELKKEIEDLKKKIKNCNERGNRKNGNGKNQNGHNENGH